MSKKVVVMGIGYVGLPLAIMLAKSGYDVAGVDVKEEVMEGVNEGRPLFVEDDIERMMAESGVRSKLKAQKAPCEADIFIISVPTPIDEKKRIADLSAVEAATRSIAPHLRPGNLVIIESTVPPLTCRELVMPILEESGLKVGKDIFLAHCPERILPGDVFKEIVMNDRVVGGIDPVSSKLAADLYSSFVEGKIVITDDITAEMTKLMENTYRDVNIALANEFAAVTDHLGVDVIRCIEIANMHPRVHILRPGIGTGGHCIP
ncbi:MAG: nucleotide sugar dehydrogenase, partial [Deltaproteobacteria bacterium]|nr:nucleotide sugar dehydrogenase [Deltaproteobacteria bacterium]